MKIQTGCLLVTLLLNGCANSLPTQHLVENRYERELKTDNLDMVTTDGATVIGSPTFRIEVNTVKSYVVKHYEHKTDYDVFTPYQGARELYEVPMGLVTFPVAVVVNVFDFALLGLIPNSATDSLLSVAFAGMNPFMNIESEDRAEKTVAREEKKLVEEKEEFIRKPHAGGVVTVAAGTSKTTKTLDANGRAEINLLGLGNPEQPAEQLMLIAEEGSASCKLQLDVTRQMCSRIKQAAIITAQYADGKLPAFLYAGGAKPDITKMAQDVLTVSKLGFENESKEIEKKVFRLLTTDDRSKFTKILDEGAL